MEAINVEAVEVKQEAKQEAVEPEPQVQGQVIQKDWCGNDLNDMDNFPFFTNKTIDFPFITPQSAAIDEPTANATDDSASKDIPVCIDINALVIPSCFKNAQVDPIGKNPSDDDVTFVKEYKRSKIGSRAIKKTLASDTPPPRRNPKRQAQMKKPTSSVSSSISVSSAKEDCKEATPASTKRATRAASAASTSTPPAATAAHEYKQWPVDGMHEKPTFNPVTKRLEKHPGALGAAKRGGCRRRRKPNTECKQSEEEEKREFATLAHHNLHYVLTYVNNVKEYNAWTGRADKSSMLPNNVVKAADILKDACIMYCIANDVSESSLAKYLDVVASKENVPEFLKGILDGDVKSGQSEHAPKPAH